MKLRETTRIKTTSMPQSALDPRFRPLVDTVYVIVRADADGQAQREEEHLNLDHKMWSCRHAG